MIFRDTDRLKSPQYDKLPVLGYIFLQAQYNLGYISTVSGTYRK